MNDLSPTDIWFITTALMIIGSIGLGIGMGYLAGWSVGYRDGIEEVAESVNEAGITGEIEEVRS